MNIRHFIVIALIAIYVAISSFAAWLENETFHDGAWNMAMAFLFWPLIAFGVLRNRFWG